MKAVKEELPIPSIDSAIKNPKNYVKYFTTKDALELDTNTAKGLKISSKKVIPTSTVGRGRAIKKFESGERTQWKDDFIDIRLGDSLSLYGLWGKPTVIISDGGYGVLGFEGDTFGHLELPSWYESHVASWSQYCSPQTTLWFWNSEIGWAAVHPILEKYGWRYVNANVWNKGKGHIAGNVNTKKIRRFPVVTEICVQYTFEPRIEGLSLKEWLLKEWKRSGLTLKKANEACGVKDAAVRKYLDQGHLWYYPPPEMFEKLQKYANDFGNPNGMPYFSNNDKKPLTAKEWSALRSKFYCPHGFTNVWDRPAVRNSERYKVNKTGKAIHLNQKPLDIISMLIEASSDAGDVVWEPFGGLFTACIAAKKLERFAFGAEIDPTYFHYGSNRLNEEFSRCQLP